MPTTDKVVVDGDLLPQPVESVMISAINWLRSKSSWAGLLANATMARAIPPASASAALNSVYWSSPQPTLARSSSSVKAVRASNVEFPRGCPDRLDWRLARYTVVIPCPRWPACCVSTDLPLRSGGRDMGIGDG